MRIHHSILALLHGMLTCVCAAQNLPLEATRDFLTARPDGWKAMYQGKKLVALYGPSDPLPVGRNAGDFLTEFATAPDNLAAYGIDSGELDFEESITLSNGKTIHRYSQFNPVENLPVHGASAKFLMSTENGSLLYIGLNLAAQNTTHLLGPNDTEIADSDAIDSIRTNPLYSSQGITWFDTPSKVVVEDKMGMLHRAWRFNGMGDENAYLFFVDTISSKLVGTQNQVLGLDGVHVQGHVTGSATQGYVKYDPVNPQTQSVELPGLRIRVAPPTDMCPVTTDLQLLPTFTCSESTCAVGNSTVSFGGYDLASLDQGKRISMSLEGQWARVRSCETGEVSSSDKKCALYAVGGICDDCTADWAACETVNPPDHTFSPNFLTTDQARLEQVNTFNVIESNHNWFRNLASLADPANPFTGIDKVAYCGVGGSVVTGNVLPLGAIVLDIGSAFSTVISHEYGHFVFNAIKPEYDLLNGNQSRGYFHEGVADAISAFFWNNHKVSDRDIDPLDSNADYHSPSAISAAVSGAFWDLRKSFLHCLTPTLTHCASDADCCAAYPDCMTGGHCAAGHCSSTSLSCSIDAHCCAGNPACATTSSHCVDGFCSALTTTSCTDFPSDSCTTGQCTDDREAEKILTNFLFLTSGVPDQRVLLEVLAADVDSNGDGHPDHEVAIKNAFRPHGWADGPAASTVKVKWAPANDFPCTDNPMAEHVCGNDVLPDYEIDDSVTPPLVTLKSTVTHASDPISDWTIGRVISSTLQCTTDLNCQHCETDHAYCSVDTSIHCTSDPDCAGWRCVAGYCSTSMDIWQIATDWRGTAANVTIHVGDQADAEYACADIGSVAIAREDGFYSNVLLNVSGTIVEKVSVDPTATGTTGGRISGVAVNGVRELQGYAIGIGNSSAGALNGGESMVAATLQDHPHDSSITTGFIEYSPNGGINVSGNIAGSITLTHDTMGDIIAKNGDITGQIRLDNGIFYGKICGNNLTSGDVLSNINMYFGPGAMICDHKACEDTVPRLVADMSGDKNRYISFSIPTEPVLNHTAIRVVLVSLQRPSPPNLPQYPAPFFGAFEGEVRWVNKLTDHTDLNCEERNVVGSPVTYFKCATLGCSPEFRDWQGDVAGQTLHVMGVEIVPSSSYSVILVNQPPNQALCASPGITLTTGRWGDVVAPFQKPYLPLTQPNISDVAAVVDKFKQTPTAPIVARADVNPGIPNNKIWISDVASIQDGFKNLAYPFPGPMTCHP